VGKSEAALTIAKHLGSPIINADSRQIYKEIPVGTAAPTPEQQKEVKHYFVGNHSIDDYYSASLYEEDCLSLIERLFNGQEDGIRHSSLLLTGGSMMYIDAVCKGIDDIPTINDETRQWMKQRLQTEGLPKLVEELHQLDPEYWAIVDKNNPRRVVHALEICHQSGHPYSFYRKGTIKQRPFRIIKIGLNRPREEMYERINQRVIEIVKQGLIEETLAVYNKRSLNALNTVGYKEMFDYLDGLITLDEGIREIQSNTRRYMRKQLTWFKKDPDIHWFSPNDIPAIIRFIDDQKL
jgi:tRNA dimethylallyltransferase